jgi:hypothetical protein
MEITKPRGSHATAARPVSIAALGGFSFSYDSAVITLANVTIRRAAWARPPRPALLAAAVQRPR